MSVPYTDSEASEARQWSNRHGPPNAWTASFGTAARMIGRLLDERERLMAEAMLRERCRAGADCPASDNAPSHDAAPAARASEATASPERVRVRGDAGTGDTPATHATRGEGSEQRECTEPVAWAVMLADGERIYDVYATEEEAKAIDEAVTGNHGVVPLYRSPTLTDAEREAVETCIADDEAMTHHSRADTLRGLLERLGGAK